ncbi:hypothetical protein [Paracoccus shanxieyensis]|uniref:Calcium-binding protein n=1 Tax=Paracoccus shanxieyensis TaxID=2675752 RepID=A0A6L6J2S2_9RHOB|nr:hypothetical protein [Paracoccus shanxieyensis]MTH65027.1 hypothetical protein [Paracoccus shanxieyensis]MTH88069.1 hypothetical protein [Paracoccus shanxieyensis]
MATPYSHLIGTNRGELLLGTSSSYDDNWSGNDLIEAVGGHDTIRSFNGADTVLGGAGNDLIVTRGPPEQ